MGFVERLEARCRATGSLLCVGIDPHPADLAAPTAEAARDFAMALIEATLPHAACFKPNAAFFEALGPEGVEVLAQVVAAIPDDVPVLLDVKRGDISSTAAAYARAAYDVLGADAVTLNAYMGEDAVAPFLDDPDKAVFVLCRTSNPSGATLQDLVVDGGERLYERVATLAQRWDPRRVGLVVGATRPDELAGVRARAPSAWILAPGVGAQGADLGAAVDAGLREDGLGLLVAVSRGIHRADDPGAAAADLVARIGAARDARAPAPAPAPDALADGLLRAGCVRFGTFTLKSGLQSPVYLDLRRLVGDPALLRVVAEAYAAKLASIDHDLLAPLPYAGLPIGTAVSLATGTPLVYPRREVKAHGTKQAVEGVFEPGQTAVLIDDLATTGTSALEALPKLTAAGIEVTDAVVLVDRESGGGAALAAAGVTLHAVTTLSALLDRWEAQGSVSAEQAVRVRAFLAETSS